MLTGVGGGGQVQKGQDVSSLWVSSVSENGDDCKCGDTASKHLQREEPRKGVDDSKREGKMWQKGKKENERIWALKEEKISGMEMGNSPHFTSSPEVK